MALAPEQTGISLRRHFTSPGVDPYDEIEWERRDARITNYKDGSVAFEQTGVEFPASWSANATNIVAQKYFRGTPGTSEREWSLRQVIDRVVDTATAWGAEGGYFVDQREADFFNAELKHVLVTQKAAFNSPVWFNIGVSGVPQQASACFILSVDDAMDSILNWYREEGVIFKGGSGAGINLSRIRSSVELLRGGGTASGPVSFMRGADASAGTIKSGGKTRRAAKMVILDAGHPDIEEFVWCKALEERKARVLRDSGFDMDLDGSDAHSIQYQNANNSVRVTDEFMQAVERDGDWELREVTTGSAARKVRARDIFRQICQAAWECADPGMQFDTTINRWHTAANTGRINASNPCFTGDTLVHTDKGLIQFAELLDRANRGEEFGVYTHDVTNPDAPGQNVVLTTPKAFMITGRNPIVRLRFDNGMELRCTPSHRIFTASRGYVEAQELTSDDQVRVLDLPTPAVNAGPALPVPTDPAEYRTKGDHAAPLQFPETWSDELAHYLGWLIGDGSTSGANTVTIYGSADDRSEILPRHADLITWINQGRPIKVSEQANGTAQLRLGRRAFKGFLEALGVHSVTGEHKVVPWSLEQAPPRAVAAFLRGLFDADGCAVHNLEKGSYVGLSSISIELLRGVQRLLSTFGISSHVYKTRDRGSSNFRHTRRDGTEVEYEHRASYDLRITSGSLDRFAAEISFELSAKSETLREILASRSRGPYDVDTTVRLAERSDEGIQLTYNLTEPRNHSYMANGVIVRNCSEYMHLDDSACNLASLNLMKFLQEDGSFDIEGFRNSVEVVFTAQEILVGRADYPTEAIAETSRRFRQLGLGYANLGALLMALGLPYDSDAGRAHAAAITSLMTGHAYEVSARTASRMGPFAGYAENREHMLRVLAQHQEAAAEIDEELVPPALLSAAQQSWDKAFELAEQYGVRNSQSVVIAPTGTIGLMMDCDTTGVEPDLGLVKLKKLVGGGTMSIVNQTVPRALGHLGYDEDQIEEIIAYIDENKSIVGAPHLRHEHFDVFACSMGDNAIHYTGHVKMMAAIQPFVSGAISKCVVGETLLPTADGLVRIGSMHRDEAPDTFRDQVIEVASLDGTQKTDAFYYGGSRPTFEVVLRSGHRVTATFNHRLLVAGPSGLDWKRMDEIGLGDWVATQYGADLWSPLPARFDDFEPSDPYGCQKDVTIPAEMTEELAFLLGAFASEGHITRTNYTIHVTNSVPAVRDRVAAVWKSLFGLEARTSGYDGRCPSVSVASKTVVEFLDYLGSGGRASDKRIPDVVLRSPRELVLAFLQGLALDAYVTTRGEVPKWAICVESPGLLDDLQAVLTNLGIVHGRIRKHNVEYDKDYGEVYATGERAQHLVRIVPFMEPDKAGRADELSAITFAGTRNTADVVPGILPAELYQLLPTGKSGRSGFGVRTEFNFLLDSRTANVTRGSLERVAAVPGVTLPPWLQRVLDDDLHFSPVESMQYQGEREVFDVSVPATHAFVGNGIVNHNTVNMPEEASVEDVEQLHIDAWKMGVKAIAIYRDNCKVGQPLSMAKKERAKDPELKDVSAAPAAVATKIVEKIVKAPVREKLPRNRMSRTFEFRVAECKGFVTVGQYEDGRPGEVFLNVAKQGSTLAGIMDAFSVSVSYGLQYGVPLRNYVEAFTNTRFEPAGITDDPDLRIATSILDYIFRRLAVDYLGYEERAELGILTGSERTQPTLPGVEETVVQTRQGLDVPADPPSLDSSSPLLTSEDAPYEPSLLERAGVTDTERGEASAGGHPVIKQPRPSNADAPMCMQCGVQMQRAGSCHACPSCGTTSGCS